MCRQAFFDIYNILPSMASSITGNDFKCAISKVSDTRDPWELNIVFIEKAALYASGEYLGDSNAPNPTFLSSIVSEKNVRRGGLFWRLNVVILDTK